MFENRLASIKQRIEIMRRLDPKGLASHDAQSHRYRLNPPATAEQVQRFEQKNGYSLPDDYREFIQQVADGGAGPPYGVYALCVENNKTGNPYCVVDQSPFPFVWRMEEDEETGELDGPFFVHHKEAEHLDTALCIGCAGCDLYVYLVVTGAETGTLWWAATEHEGAYGLCLVNGQERVSFLDWYEHWCDATLPKVTAV